MKTNNQEYDTPLVEVSYIAYEGVLCKSGNTNPYPGWNESYGGDPSEEDSIF